MQKEKKSKCTNCHLHFSTPYVVMMYNFVLALFVYTLSRLFFVWVNAPFFSDLTPQHLIYLCANSLRFDFSALLYINIIYLLLMLLPFRFRHNLLYQKIANGFYLSFNIVGIIANTMDIAYFQFTNRRTTCTIFTEFMHEENLIKILFIGIIRYWYVTLFGIAMILLLIMGRAKLGKPVVFFKKWFYYIVHTAILLPTIYFIIIGVRGGFGSYTRPINISNAAQYTQTPTETAIVLNTPFSLIQTIQPTTYINPLYFSNEDTLKQVYTPIHIPVSNQGFQPLNVVIIILESFSKEYIGFFNTNLDDGKYCGYTPFLDSLLTHSLTFTKSFASGRKSIDAMPSTLSSIPSFIEPYTTTPYANNNITSVATYLKQKGYYSAFFHGAPNASMGFQAYARAAGFQNYFGMDDYPNKEDFDGTWAIWDEEFLQFFAQQMNSFAEPFVSAVFTASSHHPFKLPEHYKNTFPKGTHPIHQTVGYSDNALRLFFEHVKQYSWYNNTLFVLTADHTNALTYPEYLTSKGQYEIPIAYYQPNSNLQGISERITQQTDIMSTILEYLHYDLPYFSFGKNVLDAHGKNDALNYNSGTYQYFCDSLMVCFDGTSVRAVYNFEQDPYLQTNLVDKIDVHVQEKTIKAMIQQYMMRMIENRLTVDKEYSK